MAIAAQTDYELGQDNIQLLGLDVHNPVFVVSSLTIVAFVAGVLAFRDASAGVFDALYAWLTSTLDWVFMGTANVFVLFCLMLLVTPLGRVRLGGPKARPDYSAWSWFAMLFAAGIGIGLMFFGVAEPVDHFLNPPLGVDPADTAAAHRLVGCMLTVPVLVSALWMNAFGATALSHHLDAGQTAVVAAVQAQQPEMALFRMLEVLPLAGLTSGVAIALLLGGGLVALQAAALATGFPFALVLVAMCYSTWKGLRAARGANP